ncbi:MAG: cyclic nucleotide-binding domain-containing protein [Panacagrimonas sp.]
MFNVFEATSPEQKEALYRFRYEVFTREQGKYRELADHQNGRLCDSLDESATHLCVANGNGVVGSLRQVRGRSNASLAMVRYLELDRFAQYPDEALSFGGRMMLNRGDRGTAALIPLLHAVYERGRAAGVLFDFIFCNPHLVAFYEQLGYRRYCSYFFDPALGFQVPLVLVADDVDHLERMRSPFAPLALRWPADSANTDWLHAAFPKTRSFISPATLGAERFVDQLAQKLQSLDAPLLSGLNASDLRDFLATCTHLQLDAGTQLVRRGDMGPELYLILEGCAEVRRNHPADASGTSTALGAGDFFGEHAVLTGEPREMDVVARTPLEVIFIDRNTLRRFVKGRPALAAKLLFNLARVIAQRTSLHHLIY